MEFAPAHHVEFALYEDLTPQAKAEVNKSNADTVKDISALYFHVLAAPMENANWPFVQGRLRCL